MDRENAITAILGALLNENRDSIELGNSKTGQVKVYVDFNDMNRAREKLENAIMLLKEKRNLIYQDEAV